GLVERAGQLLDALGLDLGDLAQERLQVLHLPVHELLPLRRNLLHLRILVLVGHRRCLLFREQTWGLPCRLSRSICCNCVMGRCNSERLPGPGSGSTLRRMSRRIAYVTGGMGGIGAAISRKLADLGHTVIAGCGPTRDKVKWLREQKEAGYTFHASIGDVADW